jgi:ATP-binding cassette subfamily B protein
MMFLHWPMLALGWTTNLIQRGIASWKRIRSILDAVPTIRDGARTDPALEQARGPIEFRGVSLARGERTLLDRIDLTIPAGQCLGITGPTGSGKTLLASLIVRMMDPTDGAVLIGGRDVRDYPVDALRRRIGVAPQEPFLFSDTLANNIALGLAETREADVHHAAEIAHLRPDVEQFPKRFETILGERGVTLSGGQRQRAAIGRALARRPDILILDDVFSAVDTQTEARIMEKLLPTLRGRTSILISHRVSTLRCADRILVLDGGRITQDGRHEDLVGADGYYRELDELQRLEAQLEDRP